MSEHIPIAVIGLACRFPGAPDADAYWDLVRGGRSGLSRFTAEQLAEHGVPARLRDHPRYIPVGGLIDGQDLFDPEPFGFGDAEAALLDPQHRLFLETAWHALEHAGHGGGRGAGAVGVFAGAMQSAYLAANLHDRWDPTGTGADPLGSLQTGISTQADYLPLQTAYRLDLTGPAVAVASSCSTSLVAVHVAAQSLLSGECDTALAGGVSLIVPQGHGYLYVPGGIFSADGEVRPFSADGTGIVYTQGVGAVVLRRLDDALADGDPIIAVLYGSAVNNDGGTGKAGFTAPSMRGQARVIAEALGVAGLTARDVGLIEAHGTATPVGDPIEAAALRRVFGDTGPAWCGIGSVKGNIGHANSAAGIASFIKAALAVRHRELPATRGAYPLNPELGLDGSPFEVIAETRPWDGPPYAGVSSFGIGGTNCHVVLGPPPDRPPVAPDPRPQLLVVSAATERAARAQAAAVAEAAAALRPDELAHTLAAGRTHQRYRVASVGPEGLGAARPVRADGERPRVVFALPGGGSQYPGMGAELYRDEPVFAAAVDACAEALLPHLGADVREALDPAASVDRLADVAFGVPALFAVSYAMAELLAAYGVRPDAMVGHSLGECTAAAVSGALPLDEAARLVAARCLVAARVAGDGVMLAVPYGEPVVAGLLARHPLVDLAAVNAPDACVVSGPKAAVHALAAELAAAHGGGQVGGGHAGHGGGHGEQRGEYGGGGGGRRGGHGDEGVVVRVAAGMHSRLVEPVLPTLRAALAGMHGEAPRVSVVSTVTGRPVGTELADPEHWARQLRATVRFADAARAALPGPAVVVQVGPGGTLLGLARRIRPDLTATVATLTSGEPETAAVRQAIGTLWAHGVPASVEALPAPGRRRVHAPGYVFQRRRLWIDPPDPVRALDDQVSADEPIQIPTWHQLPPANPVTPPTGRWAVLGSGPLTTAIAALLAEGGATVVPLHDDTPTLVVPDGLAQGGAGSSATAVPDGVVRDGARSGAAVVPDGRVPDGVGRGGAGSGALVGGVVSDGVARPVAGSDAAEAPDGVVIVAEMGGETPDAVAEQVLRFGSAAGAVRPGGMLLLVTRHGERVGAEPPPNPGAAALRTLPLVLGQEQPGVRWVAVDLGDPGPPEREAQAILAELGAAPDSEGVAVAVRGPYRWTRRLSRWRPGPDARSTPEGRATPNQGAERSRPPGGVLIIGGLGSVGRLLARRFAEAGHRVVVTSRTADRAADLPGVEVRRCDAADPAATMALLAELSADGPLELVVQAAGVVAEARLDPLRALDPDEVARHVRAKAGATAALRAAVDALPVTRRPRTVVLMSSATTLVGGIGMGPYAAANAAMDALGQTAGEDPDTRWVSAVWDGWRVGDGGRDRTVALAEALDGDTGLRALDRLLAATNAPFAPLVAIATTDLNPRVAQARRVRTPADAADGAVPAEGGPDDAVARAVAAIWSELFGVPVREADADFFALGGHSLLAVRMLGMVAERFGVTLGLRDLLAAPTVADIADRVTADQVAADRVAADRARAVDDDAAHAPVPAPGPPSAARSPFAEDGTFAMTRVQHAYWVGRDGGYGLGDRPCHFYLEYDCPGLDPERFERAWNRVIARHPMLRCVTTPSGRWAELPRVPHYRIRVHDLVSASPRRRAERLAALRDRVSAKPGPPDRWPLVQIQAARLPGDRIRLFIGVDVLVCDAASWWIIESELRDLYRNPDAEPPEVDVHPAHCVAALAARPADETVAYWRDRLDTLPGPPALPVREPEAGTPRFSRRAHRLNRAQWAALRTAAARHRVTPTAVLLTAYTDALAAWAGRPGFCVTLTMFDRPPIHPQVNAVVGDFTSLVLHETPRRPAATFAERAAATQRRLFADLDHRAYSALEVLSDLAARTGTVRSVPVVFTSALGMDELLGGGGALEWAGEQVHAVSQTPQTWLDHQVLVHDGELRMQWDAPDGLLPGAELDKMIADQIARVETLAADADAWTRPDGPAAVSAGPDAVAGSGRGARGEVPGVAPGHDIVLPLRAEGGDRPTLYLVHPSGGDVLCYAELSRLIDPRVDVVALADPELADPAPGGPVDPATPFGGGHGPDTVPGIAERYLAAIGSGRGRGPWLLGGWSMGGTVAQEMARRLHAAGERVDLLVLLDSNDPALIRAVPGADRAEVEFEVAVRHLRALEAFLDVDLDTGDALAAVPPDRRMAAIAERLRAHRLLGRGEDVGGRLRVFARHLRALAAHVPGRLADPGTVTLLVRAELRSPRNSGVGMGVDDTPPDRPDLGWGAYLAAPPRVAGVAAHHYSLLRPPALPAVAELINTVFDEVPALQPLLRPEGSE